METNRRSPFGIQLRQFREAAGLSQEALAERAGLSLRGISDLERGLRTTPRLETVRMLADGLGLDDAQRTELLASRNTSNDIRFHQITHRSSALPVPPTSFIGRGDEVDTVVKIFATDRPRLLTLTGPGGVGKTRIAIEAAHQLAGTVVDEAIFIDLSPVRQSEHVISAIADRLGVPGQSDMEIRDVLAVALHGRSMLMVLDNLEQVIDAATDIAWLLAACPDLTILATSRVLLRIGAEHILVIDPMTLPAGDDVNSLEQSESVTLFGARAFAADHEFTLNQKNAAAVAAVVTRLQGMPLAIELAAARLRLLSMTDLAKRLEAQLPVLAGGARDAPVRHRTMRDTIAWSYELLSPAEQAVFRTLSIFPDGCTLETAVAILGFDGGPVESDALDAVEMLIDSSILRPRKGTDGQVRFSMLQIVQEFGLDHLKLAGEETMVLRAAHDAWAVPLARRAENLQSGHDAVFWVNRIEAELQNLRQHQTWLIENDYVEDALDISGSFAPFRSLRAQFDEARRELEMLLAHPHSQHPTRARVRANSMLGFICLNQGDTEQALESLQEGIAIARQLDERWYLAQALILTGSVLTIRGQLEESEACAREGLLIAAELNSPFLIARGTGGLAMVFSQRGEMQDALELWEKAVAISQSIGNPWGMALCMNNLAYTWIRDGEIEKGEALLLVAQILLMELGDKRDLPGVNLNLAILARLRGDLPKATQIIESTLATAMRSGNMYDIAHSNLNLASIARLKGDLDAARSLAHRAITWFERCGNVVDAIYCLGDVAAILIDAGEHSRAAWCLGAVDGVFSKRGIALADSEIAERQARVDNVVAALGEAAWHSHYDRAFAMSEDDVLAEVKSWQQCY